MEKPAKIKNLTSFSRELTRGTVANFEVESAVNLAEADRSRLKEITNCHFHEKISLTNYEANSSVTFTDCIFERDLIVTKTTFHSKLIFINCEFKSELLLNSINFKRFEFSDSTCLKLTFKGNINREDENDAELNIISGTIDTFTIDCKQIHATMNLTGGIFKDMYFNGATFNRSLTIEGKTLKFEFMNFDSCTFMERVDFNISAGGSAVMFLRSTFNHMLIFHEKFKCDSVRLNSIVAKQKVSLVSNGMVSSLSLDDCDFTSSLDVIAHRKSTKNDSHSFSCDLHGFIRGNLIFENIVVSTITLQCSNFGNIMFRNTDTHLITIKNFQNYNRLTFANLRMVYEKHHLIIFDSNIDKTEFVNVDFKKFNEIVIARSEVSNLTLSNCSLPEKFQIGTEDPRFGYIIAEEEKINDNMYHRENFRQLKMAMEKQGNRDAALRFKSREMHYLRKELRWGWDKVLLYLNYFSNNHGLS
jgi:hypothetical protein